MIVSSGLCQKLVEYTWNKLATSRTRMATSQLEIWWVRRRESKIALEHKTTLSVMRKYLSFFHSTSDYATWLETQNSKEAKVFFISSSFARFISSGWISKRAELWSWDPFFKLCNDEFYNEFQLNSLKADWNAPLISRFYTIDQHAYWVFLIYIHGAPWKHFNNALGAREIICDVSNYTVDIYVQLSREARYAIDRLAENRRVINHFKTLRGERTFKQFFHINSQDHQLNGTLFARTLSLTFSPKFAVLRAPHSPPTV